MTFKQSITAIKGIQFVVDDTGEKTAVIIDLAEWGEVWEDFYDVLVSKSRKDEPVISWEELKAESKQEKIKNGGEVRCWASALLKALKCHNIYS